MSITPDAARNCAHCSTPWHPGSMTCSTCGHADRVDIAPAGPPARAAEPPWGPTNPAPAPSPGTSMAEWAHQPAGPWPLAAPPADTAALPPTAGPAFPPPVSPPPYGHPDRTVRIVTSKSPGVAAVLSIWLGVGHLYVGENVLGFCLLAFYLLLCLLSFVPILWILTIPVWFIAFILVAMNASKAAKNFNHRNGIVVR